MIADVHHGAHAVIFGDVDDVGEVVVGGVEGEASYVAFVPTREKPWDRLACLGLTTTPSLNQPAARQMMLRCP